MATMKAYEQGVPNWVDLSTPDPEASTRFYRALFGWEITEHETGNPDAPYLMGRLDGRPAAGMMLQDPNQAAQGVPPMWSMYIAVDDVEAATARAKEAGAQVLVGPMDVMDEGRMSFVMDPTGAAVGLWEAKDHVGAEAVNEPGAFNWSEVVTNEPEKLDPFYANVVGARFREIEFGGGPYTSMQVDGRTVGGTMKPQQEGTPPHWHVYFQVEDADAAAATAKEEGGSVMAGPFDTPAGRIAVIRDPHGAMFSVIQPGD